MFRGCPKSAEDENCPLSLISHFTAEEFNSPLIFLRAMHVRVDPWQRLLPRLHIVEEVYRGVHAVIRRPSGSSG
eukprot:561170-Prorocentrum_minimum.AAC.1